MTLNARSNMIMRAWRGTRYFTLSTQYLVLSTCGTLILALTAAPLLAQVDPFGAPMAGVPIAGEPAATAPEAKTKPAEPAEEAKPEPLVIQLLRDSNPTSPIELLQAAEVTFQFGRADECKRYLAKLLAGTPADDAIAPLAGKFPDFLVRISLEKEIQPEGKQAADRILDAAQRVAQNPERIKALIAQLSVENARYGQRAVSQLAAAGANVVTPLLQVLADAERETEHRHVRAALVQLGGVSELPLIGALETPTDDLKAQVIAVLGRMKARRAIVHLLRPAIDPHVSGEVRALAVAALTKIVGKAPDLYESETYLRNEIGRLLRGELPYPSDANDRVELWSWDEAANGVVARKLPKQDAALVLAARLANDLYRLKPGDSSAQRLMLLVNLEMAGRSAIESGWRGQAALPSLALRAGVEAGPQVMSRVLDDAMKQGRVAAALAAIEILSTIGDPSILHTQSASFSPLAEAMHFSDRRVRLAAALAAVKLAPGGSFPGAGRVSETLGWFAATSGTSSVLVGHPRAEDGQSLVGLMNELGYEGEAAYTGRTLAQRAFQQPDFEFILISDAIDSPPVKELVQWLRRDFRTVRMPVGVIGREENLSALREAFAEERYTRVFPGLPSADVAATEVGRLRALEGRNYVGRDERIEQARSALRALATLAKDAETLASYDLLRQEPRVIQALYQPALSAAAASVLGLYRTPRAQKALTDFTNQLHDK